MSVAGPILEVRKVSRRFGGVWALRDVSFDVAPRERVGVIGPNGAGKTTLLNCVIGSPPPSEGQILFDGTDVTGRPSHAVARLGISRSFQLVNLFGDMTVRDNLLLAVHGREPAYPFRFHRRFGRDPRDVETVDAILEENDLADRRDVHASELAYGEQRRVDLLMAVVGAPRVVLLDEPSAGLTTTETSRIVATLRQREALSVVIIDHDVETVFEVADRVIVLHEGKVIAAGAAEEIQRDAIVRQAYFGEVEV